MRMKNVRLLTRLPPCEPRRHRTSRSHSDFFRGHRLYTSIAAQALPNVPQIKLLVVYSSLMWHALIVISPNFMIFRHVAASSVDMLVAIRTPSPPIAFFSFPFSAACCCCCCFCCCFEAINFFTFQQKLMNQLSVASEKPTRFVRAWSP